LMTKPDMAFWKLVSPTPVRNEQIIDPHSLQQWDRVFGTHAQFFIGATGSPSPKVGTASPCIPPCISDTFLIVQAARNDAGRIHQAISLSGNDHTHGDLWFRDQGDIPPVWGNGFHAPCCGFAMSLKKSRVREPRHLGSSRFLPSALVSSNI